MTVVLALRCADGIVLASDSQITDPGRGVSYPAQKLHPLGDNAAWGGSGSRAVLYDIEQLLNAEPDAVVIIARVKSHTSFDRPIESGLTKMVAVGLGKQEGARNVHRLGPRGYSEVLPALARIAIEASPVAFGIAVVESGFSSRRSVFSPACPSRRSTRSCASMSARRSAAPAWTTP